MARILVTWNFHPNEGGGLAARKIASELRGLGHEVECLRLPFKGSNWHSARTEPVSSTLFSRVPFRDIGSRRLVLAVRERRPDFVLDVHTTDSTSYVSPGAPQGKWRLSWGKVSEGVRGRDKSGRIRSQVGFFSSGHIRGYVALELPAQTRVPGGRWKEILVERLLSAGSEMSDFESYFFLHRPVRLEDATAKRIATAFHDFVKAGGHVPK